MFLSLSFCDMFYCREIMYLRRVGRLARLRVLFACLYHSLYMYVMYHSLAILDEMTVSEL